MGLAALQGETLPDNFVCADGRLRILWETPYNEFLRPLLDLAKDDHRLDFRVFRQRGKGQIEEWALSPKGRLKPITATTAAR